MHVHNPSCGTSLTRFPLETLIHFADVKPFIGRENRHTKNVSLIVKYLSH